MRTDIDQGRPPAQGERLFHLRMAEAAGIMARCLQEKAG